MGYNTLREREETPQGKRCFNPKEREYWEKCNIRRSGEFRKCTHRERGTYYSPEGTNETPCSWGNSGSIPSEEEGLTIPSKGQMEHPVVWVEF